MRRATALAVPIRRLSRSIAMSAQFTLEMCATAENCKKNPLKPPILEIQGHLRSSMLTPLNSVSVVLVMISSMSVSICNCFHFKRANSGKITTF